MLDVWVIAPEDLPIPPNRGGSVQIYIYALMAHLASNKDLSLTLISPSLLTKNIKTNLINSGYKHIIIPSHHGDYLKNVAQLVQQRKPDIIQIENRPRFVHTIRQCHPSGKIILNLHSTTFVSPRNLTTFEEKRCFSSVDIVVCNSHYLKNMLFQKLKLSVLNRKTSVIHPGVDLHKFHQLTNKKLHTPVRLLYVGRVIRQKGLHIILQCLPLLKKENMSVELIVIGRTPPWESQYAQFIQSLSRNQSVKQEGFISPSKLPAYYQNADIFLCPSQHNEAFGLVNIEAMASGVPVIASKVGGIIETVTSTCGIIVNHYKKPAAFANAISTLIENPDLWKQKSLEAKQQSTRFSWEHTSRQFINLYSSITK